MAYRRLKLRYNRGDSSVSNAKAPEYLYPYKIETPDSKFNFAPLLQQQRTILIDFDLFCNDFQWGDKLQLEIDVGFDMNNGKYYAKNCSWGNTKLISEFLDTYWKLYLFRDEIRSFWSAMNKVKNISNKYGNFVVQELNRPIDREEIDGPRTPEEFAYAIQEPLKTIQDTLNLLCTDVPMYLKKEWREFSPDGRRGSRNSVSYRALTIDVIKQMKYLYCFDWNDSVIDKAYNDFLAAGNTKTCKKGEKFKNCLRRFHNKNRTWRIKKVEDLEEPEQKKKKKKKR